MSTILYGRRGSCFGQQALSLVRKALCTKTGEENCNCYSCSLALSSHPDFVSYEKDSYTVDDIDAIVAFSHETPVFAKKKVVLMYNLSSVTEISQNKLLKELEDNSSFTMIATADSLKDNILPTIKSRTEAKKVPRETKEEFFSSVTVNADILYRMTGGYSGLANEMEEQIPIYQAVETAFIQRDGKKLLGALHLIVDKDKQSYFEKYSDFIPNLFDFIGKLAIEGADMSSMLLLETINKSYHSSLMNGYSKTAFFTSMVNISESL